MSLSYIDLPSNRINKQAASLAVPEQKVIQGDALNVLREYPSNHFDAVVCDPPYGLTNDFAVDPKLLAAWAAGEDYSYEGLKGLLGAEWDGGVPQPSFWREVFRVLKPGGHVAAFSAARTQYLTTTAIAHADFEIRDILIWLHHGFPKFEDQGPMVEKAMGLNEGGAALPKETRRIDGRYGGPGRPRYSRRRVATTPEGKRWTDHRAGLRGVYDPIVLARKPLAESNIAMNLATLGTGALNIGACRLNDGVLGMKLSNEGLPEGSYPTNAVGLNYDERIFYYPRTTKEEANAYLPPEHQNDHPCAKPLALMRWLTNLVCPEGGLVLAPFAGSGSGGVAAVMEGFGYVGIERDDVYFERATRRVHGAKRAHGQRRSA